MRWPIVARDAGARRVSPPAATQALPTIVILATGGTIAGAAAERRAGRLYRPARSASMQLLAAVPQAKKLANLAASRSRTSARRT